MISFADGLVFLRRMRRALRVRATWEPPVAVLLPIRGFDSRLEDTLRALESQRYPRYRLIVVTDADDEAEDAIRALPRRDSTVLVRAKPQAGCSGKIAALLTGLDHLEPEDELVAFADSDIHPDPDWLAQLVAPLGDDTVAAATGYRWYFPLRPGLGPALQSAWNSAAANVLFSTRWVYLWGGSCVVRRKVLESLALQERWRRSLSDDMVLTRALKEAGHRLVFAPRATVRNDAVSGFKEVMRWTHRQACMALLYAPDMARLTLPYGLYAGSLALAVLAASLVPVSRAFLLPALLLLSPVALGLGKNVLRRAAFRQAMPSFRPAFARHRVWFYLATAILPFVMLLNVRRARRTEGFTWRGRRYRFRGPEEVEFVGPSPTPPRPPPPGPDRTRRGGSDP